MRAPARSWLLWLLLGISAALAGEADPLDEACWIWSDKDTNAIGPPLRTAEFSFSRDYEVKGEVKSATLRVTAESVYTLLVNDKQVGADDFWLTLDSHDIKPFLVQGKNRILIKAQTKTWFAGLFVVGTVELADGRKLAIRSDATWDCTNDLDGKTARAEVVIQGLNGGWWNNCNRLMVMPDQWYRLNTELVTPCIPWAKPLAGGRLKLLIIQPRVTQRDTVELLQRADVDATVVFSDFHVFTRDQLRQPFFPLTKGQRREDIVADLTKALQGSYDAIVLGPVEESVFYEVVADKLKAMVQGGTGLIYTAIPPRKVVKEGEKKPVSDPTFEKELTAAPVAAPPPLLAQGVPYAALPGFRLGEKDKEKDYRKVAALFQFGKGRVMRLGLASGWGLFANAPDRNDLHYEYYQAFALKAMLWVVGREPSVQFQEFPATVQAERGTAGEPSTPLGPGLAFRLAGKGDYTVSLAVRCPERLLVAPGQPIAAPGPSQNEAILRPLHEARQEVKLDGAAAVRFPLPTLPAGSYFLDVIVSDGKGNTNWATAALEVASPLRIREIKLAPPWIDVADGKAAELKATAALSAPAPDGASVRFGLLDNCDRLLDQAEAKLAKGAEAAEATFRLKSFATTLGRVRAELRVANATADVAIARFTAVRRDWDRFFFVGWAGSPANHAGNVYARVLASLGFDAGRGMRVTHDTLEAADTVALPGYSGLPRRAFDITPEQLKRAQEATEKLKEQRPFDPVAYYCGDEIDYGGGDELPGRIVEFRSFLRDRYRTIAALNEQWGTSYASFDKVYPIARRAQLQESEKGKLILQKDYHEQATATGNYSRWIDQWLSNYKAFNDMARRPRRVIRLFDPHARVGVDCPMWPFASCGHDWYTFMQEFEMFAPYGKEGEVLPYEDARSFARPGAFLGLEYGGYIYNAFVRGEELTDIEWHHWRIWHGLLRGFTSTWFYQLTPPGNESCISPGLTPVPTLEQYARDLAAIRGGYYTLFTRARRDYGGIALHYSVPSRLLCPILPDLGAERAFTFHYLLQILRDQVGQPYTMLANEQIKRGGLSGYRVLIMPLSLAIGEEEARELTRFVRRGGLLIADARPGLADESGRVGHNAAISALFGLTWKKELGRKMLTGSISGDYKGVAIETPVQKFPADPAVVLNGARALCEVDGIPLVTCHDVGAGSAVCLNIPFNYYRGYPTPEHLYAYIGEPGHNRLVGTLLAAILRAHQVAPPVRVDCPGDRWLPGLDASAHADGRATYVGLTKQRKAKLEGESEVVVHAPTRGHVYDMLNGRYVGQEPTWRVKLAAADVQLFSMLPYTVKALRVTLRRDPAARGAAIEGRVRIERTGGLFSRSARHFIGLQVARPDGQTVRYLARTLETRGGSADFVLPLALNEPTGVYTLTFRDIATGATATVQARVE
ncbi:MAG TPA: beta-galactosidase trimerization domain-containing protein [Planctomycetota bacterium]|nr:beta-galactosidase trimerization domain-containing protein [Planctomycetota bacterium]